MSANDKQQNTIPVDHNIAGFNCKSLQLKTPECDDDLLGVNDNDSTSPQNADNFIDFDSKPPHIPPMAPILQHQASMIEIVSSAKVKDNSSGLIIGFHPEVLEQFCNQAHKNYNPSFNFNDFNTHLFIVNEMWLNRNLLSDTVEYVAKWHGFSSKKDRNTICCSRYGQDNSKRPYTNGKLLSNCTYCNDLKPSKKKSYWPNERSKKLPYKYKDFWLISYHKVRQTFKHTY